jgi:glycerol-3-phosphate acyltransferase PlsX
MSARRIIALDAMGGDHGPEVVIPGAAIALVRHPDLGFILVGDEKPIGAELATRPALAERSRIVHTELVVSMRDKPSQALRRGKGSSMWLALEAVRKGEAHAAVSAGNTGALMAMAKLVLRPLRGIERPAIAALWPTVSAECIVLDVGANIGASARQLSDFALMGAAMARALFHLERPTVGLLNVGVEEIKGAEEVRQAHTWLKETAGLPLEYRGFVEGHQIGQGVVDVVVVEGFAGNIALKTAEGTARQVGQYLKDALSRSPASRLGALLARGGLKVLKEKMDPRRVNGGTFLGLNGIAVKSHGGTDALGFASAVDLGYDMAESGLLERLAADLDGFHHKLGEAI